MHYLSLLLLFLSQIGLAQGDAQFIACPESKRTTIEEVFRISELPNKMALTDLNNTNEDSIPIKKRNQLIISLPNVNSLYVGFPTLLHVVVGNRSRRNINLECDGCDTLFQLNEDDKLQWVINPKDTSEVVLRTKNKKGKTLSTVEIPVFKIPQPKVILDSLDAQSTIKTLPEQMRVKFTENVPLTMSFSIHRWEIYVNEERFAGYGSAIPKIVHEYMIRDKRGTIRIDVSYFTPNGKERTREIFAFYLKDK